MDLNKEIFIYWHQGWENAPDLVRFCRDSWRFHNPDYKITLIDSENVAQYLDGKIFLHNNSISVQAASDILRLSLLASRGGIWADATMLCIQPLNNWIREALEPSKFWMYHGRDNGRGPASWFMAATTDSFLIQSWFHEVITFWRRARSGSVEYYWMDRIFSKLAINNKEFFDAWKRVPAKNCEKIGSAHQLARTGYFVEKDKGLIESIKSELPFAVKLNWRGDVHPITNEWSIIEFAFNDRSGLIPRWEEQPNFRGANFFNTLKPKKVFIDCGTHFGQGLDIFMKRYEIDPNWLVFSFEANPITFQINQENNSIDCVYYFNAAIGSVDGDVEINVESPPGEGETGMGSSIITLTDWNPQDGKLKDNFKTKYRVPIVDIARFIQEYVDFGDFLVIKMDIEGAEYDCLEKLLDSGEIKKISSLSVEWHSHYFKSSAAMMEREQKIRHRIKSEAPHLILEEWH